MTKEIGSVTILAISSVIVLFLLTKLMGYRQMSQMSLFDYINGITIGSIAAEMATDLENYHLPLTAMIVYGLAAVCLSWISQKSMSARRFLNGKPLILLHHDTLYEENLKKAKIDLNEFLEQCRVSGYFDIAQLQTVILEGNGKLSFLPKAEERPATPADLNLTPDAEDMTAALVLDGHIMEKNLRHSGKDKKWLTAHLSNLGYPDTKEVLLATCDLNNKLTVFAKNRGEHASDILN
ncbi:DUF421 domain-containing protein [Lachnospiraceae bacterium 47-T17]